MQYALIPVSDDVRRLVDANELQTLELYKDSVTELPHPSEEGPFFVCYGSYMPQPGVSPEKALEDLMEARNHWLGHIARDTCHAIAFHNVEAYGGQSHGHSVRIPFSAVIQADPVVIENIGKKSVQAVTAFLRFAHQMTAVDNILNRPGIIAFKGIERRHKDELVTLENWKTFADSERAKRTCKNIF